MPNPQAGGHRTSTSVLYERTRLTTPVFGRADPGGGTWLTCIPRGTPTIAGVLSSLHRPLASRSTRPSSGATVLRARVVWDQRRDARAGRVRAGSLGRLPPGVGAPLPVS